MEGSVIAIGGPPGSGKSTSARAIAQFLHRRYVSAGGIFRAEASRRQLSLADFGKLAQADPQIDLQLDEAMIGEASPHVVLEGRIIGELLARRRIPVYRVIVTAEESIRAGRIVHRDGGDLPGVLAAMRVREESERDRYLRYYGIDLHRPEAELIVDASVPTAAEVVRTILRALPKELRDP